MELSMENIIQRRCNALQDLGFDKGKFHYLSYVGKIPELQGDYLRTDEADYPCWGMNLMVICVSSQLREAATLIEKLCAGQPWLLVQWIVDRGQMIEHVHELQRWKDYGVSFNLRYANVGDCFYSDLAEKYLEAMNG